MDYQGKRVDIGQFGPVIGLIIGLGQLNCSEIRLKRISHKSGSVMVRGEGRARLATGGRSLHLVVYRVSLSLFRRQTENRNE